MTEHDFKRQVIRYANGLPGTKAIPLSGSIFSRRGTPDVLVVHRGHALFIETKRRGEKPRPQQQHEMNEWMRVGARVAVIETMMQARTCLAAFTGGA